MEENKIQTNFDVIHSFFVRKFCDDKTTVDQNAPHLFSLILAYNELCKAYGMPVKHSIDI